MKHATLADLKEIYWQFRKRKDVFPHVRRDKLQKMIEKSRVIWQDGVVIQVVLAIFSKLDVG